MEFALPVLIICMAILLYDMKWQMNRRKPSSIEFDAEAPTIEELNILICLDKVKDGEKTWS